MTLGIILRDPLDDILRGLLPPLPLGTADARRNFESELGARVRFQTFFGT
jgi:hypothetical protein